MKISSKRVRQIINEELSNSGLQLNIPAGMSKPSQVYRGHADGEYNHVSDYARKGLAVPVAGTYSSSSGYIAAIDANGNVYVYVPSNNTKRSISYEDMTQLLDQSGFRDAGASFYVPGSSKGL